MCGWRTNNHIPYHRALVFSKFNSATSTLFYHNIRRNHPGVLMIQNDYHMHMRLLDNHVRQGVVTVTASRLLSRENKDLSCLSDYVFRVIALVDSHLPTFTFQLARLRCISGCYYSSGTAY